MLFLNDSKTHNGKPMAKDLMLKKMQNYEEDGVIIYPIGSLIPFAATAERKGTLPKRIGDAFKRSNVTQVFVTTDQIVPIVNDLIIEANSKEHIITQVETDEDAYQAMFLNDVSRTFYIGVETNE